MVEVAADAEMRPLNSAGPKDLARPADRIVLGMVEIVDIVHVGPEIWRKEFCIHRRLFGAVIAVQPGEVCERKELRSRSLVGRLGGRQRPDLTLRLRGRSAARTGRRGERL